MKKLFYSLLILVTVLTVVAPSYSHASFNDEPIQTHNHGMGY